METQTALAISVLLITCVMGVYVLAKSFYTYNILGQNLQASADNALAKIIKDGPEPDGTFRLSEAVSFTQPSLSELHFTGTDGIERWITLSGDGQSIIYHRPGSGGVMEDDVLYTAPSGAILTLRFWTPAGTNYTGVNICIAVAVVQNIQGKSISGSASTMVNIRNHPT